MTRWFIFLFCGVLCAAGCSGTGKDIVHGNTGPLTWVLSEDGTLTISGKGEMPDFEYLRDGSIDSITSPWDKYRDDITCVIVGDEVSKIGELAYFKCVNLTSVTIGSSVTAIGNAAFWQCFILTDIFNYCEKPPQTVSETMFKGEPMTGAFGHVFKPNCTLWVTAGSVKAYRTADVWNGFYKVGIINDPSSVAIGGAAGPLTWTVSDENNFTVSGMGDMPDYNAMQYNESPWYDYRNIIHAEIEEGVSRIGNQAFFNYFDLASISIGNSVTSIGSSSFAGCRSLTSIIIPNSVTSIDGAAFAGCAGLTAIINENAVPQKIVASVFSEEYMSACTLFVPESSIGAYRTADVWKKFGTIKTIQR